MDYAQAYANAMASAGQVLANSTAAIANQSNAIPNQLGMQTSNPYASLNVNDYMASLTAQAQNTINAAYANAGIPNSNLPTANISSNKSTMIIMGDGSGLYDPHAEVQYVKEVNDNGEVIKYQVKGIENGHIIADKTTGVKTGEVIPNYNKSNMIIMGDGSGLYDPHAEVQYVKEINDNGEVIRYQVKEIKNGRIYPDKTTGVKTGEVIPNYNKNNMIIMGDGSGLYDPHKDANTTSNTIVNNESTNTNLSNNSNSSITTSTSVNNLASSSTSEVLAFNNNSTSEIISRISECQGAIEKLVNDVKTQELTIINNSWIADEAKVYTSKVENSANEALNINSMLNVLSNTYKEVLNETNRVNNDIYSLIGNLN